MVAARTLTKKQLALESAHLRARVGPKTRVGGINFGAGARVGARARRSEETHWEISARRREIAVGSRRYLQPEPALQNPFFVKVQARMGHSLPTYSYALNNPIAFVDSDGFTPTYPPPTFPPLPSNVSIAGVASPGASAAAALAGAIAAGAALINALANAINNSGGNNSSSASSSAPYYNPPSDYCKAAAIECREQCEDKVDSRDRCSQGFPFFNCVNACLERNGCPPGMY
jgi:hypothetical protein